MSWPWSELGLSGPADLTEIRRAYALRLKDAHPEENPEAFQRLHSAYQTACRMARQKKRQAPPPERPPERASSPGETERDREALPEEKEGPGERSEKEAPAEPDWDYDALLKGRERPGEQPEKEASAEPDWDYDALLKGRERPGEQPEKKEAPPEPDWDYERLFAEGDAEAEAARRKRLEELRRKNQERYKAEEQEQRRRAESEEAAWSAVMAATHALELLHSASAPVSEWRRFLDSPVFRNVKANLDFIFALEDFLEQTASYLPKEIKRAVFSAYGFEDGPKSGEYRRLYQLLGGKAQARRRFRPAIGWFRPGTKRGVKVFAALWMAFIFTMGLWGFCTNFFRDGHEEEIPWVEQCRAWLSEDWGCEFLRPFPDKGFRFYMDKDREDVREACVYAPADHPDWYFFAYEDGGRDPEAGSPGYGSNYTCRLVMGAIQEFAREQDLELSYDSAGGGFNATLGETPGAYLLQLPLTGAGTSITALGDLLSALREEDWYQRDPPEFEVFLCYGNVHFYSSLSSEGDFDGDYARAVYENKWGQDVCRHIAEETGAAAESLGADNYVLLQEGTVTLEGEGFFWVSARDPSGSQTLAHYFLSQDGTALYCIPADWLEREDLTLALLRQGEPEIRTVEDLGAHGTIRVRNHVSRP